MDIQSMIIELRRLGMTDKAIGDFVGAHGTHINRLRHGKRTKTSYDVGNRLELLLARKQGERVGNF